MSEKIFEVEKIITQHDVENKQLNKENDKLRREENEKLRKEENQKLRKEENEKLKKENEQLRKENEQLRKNNVVKDVTIKEPIEIKSFKEDKNMADNYLDWFDKNRFKKFLAVIDINKLNCKNKIGEFKYINIKDLVNNIKNTLNEIENAEIKHKKCTPGQKD